MKTELCAGLAMAVGLGLGSAAVAQDRDWEFQEDAARNVSLAAVRFDGGATVVVQCHEGALTVVLAGLPATAVAGAFQATRADGRSDAQNWVVVGSSGALRSTEAHRDARFLRGGGSFSIQSAGGAGTPYSGVFELPAQTTNLDRVLTTCGWPLTDERDRLARASGAVSLTNPYASSSRSSSRSLQSRGTAQRSAAPPLPRGLPAERQVSCIVRDRHAVDCRLDHPVAAASPAAAMLQRIEGERLFGDDVAAAEGKVFFPFETPTTTAEAETSRPR